MLSAATRFLTGNPNVLYTLGQQCKRKRLAVTAYVNLSVCCCDLAKEQVQRQGNCKERQLLNFRSC